MSDSQADYIKLARKFGRFVVASKVSVEEYAENLLTSCVTYSEIDEESARLIAREVPPIARERLMAEVSRVLAPDYRFPELHYGGPGPNKEHREERRRTYEARIRAYAALLSKALPRP